MHLFCLNYGMKTQDSILKKQAIRFHLAVRTLPSGRGLPAPMLTNSPGCRVHLRVQRCGRRLWNSPGQRRCAGAFKRRLDNLLPTEHRAKPRLRCQHVRPRLSMRQHTHHQCPCIFWWAKCARVNPHMACYRTRKRRCPTQPPTLPTAGDILGQPACDCHQSTVNTLCTSELHSWAISPRTSSITKNKTLYAVRRSGHPSGFSIHTQLS